MSLMYVEALSQGLTRGKEKDERTDSDRFFSLPGQRFHLFIRIADAFVVRYILLDVLAVVPYCLFGDVG